MTTLRSRFRLVVLLLAALTVAPLVAWAEEPASGGKSIAAALQPFVDSHSLAGAVTLVADKDKVLSLDAVGFADVAAKKPMQTDALFWIASQSKPITAAALMMLVDEGKVKLDDPVEKYLPEFKDQWWRWSRTRTHVLQKPEASHHGPRHPQPHQRHAVQLGRWNSRRSTCLPLRDAVRSYAKTPLQFEPGTQVPVFQRRHQHGRPHHRGGQRHALRGLPGQAPVRAARHEGHDLLAQRGAAQRGWRSRTSRTRTRPASKRRRSASSSIRSTTASGSRCRPAACSPRPSDVGRFCQMVLNGGIFEGKRYLSEAAVKQMTSKQTGDASRTTTASAGPRAATTSATAAPIRDEHDDRPEARADHRVDGAARRLSAGRRQEPRGVQPGGNETLREEWEIIDRDCRRASSGAVSPILHVGDVKRTM